MFGCKPPAGLSKDLLGRMIAMRLQEQAFGGLDRESLTFLGGLARRVVPQRRDLKAGTVLGTSVAANAFGASSGTITLGNSAGGSSGSVT